MTVSLSMSELWALTRLQGSSRCQCSLKLDGSVQAEQWQNFLMRKMHHENHQPPLSLGVGRSVSPHSLRCFPNPACHSLWGCSLPAPPAGCSQTSSDHRTQPCARSGLLPPSPTPLHEYEHELHSILPQVSVTASCRADLEALTSLTSCTLSQTHTHTHSVFLQPPGFSLHRELLHSPTGSSGGSSSSTVPPCSSGRSRSSLPSAASAWCPGPDAGSPLQHRSQGHPQLLSGIPGQYV